MLVQEDTTLPTERRMLLCLRPGLLQLCTTFSPSPRRLCEPIVFFCQRIFLGFDPRILEAKKLRLRGYVG